MKRTYPYLYDEGLALVRRVAEQEGLKVTQTNRTIVIEGDDKSVQRASNRLHYHYDNGDGEGLLSKEEYPSMFW